MRRRVFGLVLAGMFLVSLAACQKLDKGVQLTPVPTPSVRASAAASPTPRPSATPRPKATPTVSYAAVAGVPQGAISQQQAVDLLKGVSAEKLGLPAPIDQYTVVFDAQVSDVQGKTCYTMSAFADLGARMENMGVFAVAVDASALFRVDARTGAFVQIQ
nr:hypothetical protein [Maliibacterium massiliense]